jgi:hypothetical protein
VVYGGGHVVGGSGRTGFGGSQSTGPIPQGWLEGGALTDPRGAEVHLVLNGHGPALSAYLPEMVQTYRAGCTDASLPGNLPRHREGGRHTRPGHLPAHPGRDLRVSALDRP